MTSLVAITKEVDGLEMGVAADGTPFLTQRGLAKVCGVDHKALTYHADAWEAGKRDGALAQLLQAAGYDEDRLYELIDTERGPVHAFTERVCTITIGYYAFNVGNPTAQRVGTVLLGQGFYAFVYRAVNYQPDSGLSPSWRQFHDRCLLNSAPHGYFSVFRELSGFVLRAIQSGLPLTHEMIPDISVGIHWAKFWEDNKLSEKYGPRRAWVHNYPDCYPQARSNPQVVSVYLEDALGEFHPWLGNVYVPYKLPVYLDHKVDQNLITRADANRLIEAVTLPRLAEAPAPARIPTPTPNTTPLIGDVQRPARLSLLRRGPRPAEPLVTPAAPSVVLPAPRRSLFERRR